MNKRADSVSIREISFPPDLPITDHVVPIREAVRQHRVVVVRGDTGSGKTTQLPRIALALGRGVHGRLIGCTQPRRLATVSVARYVAESFGERPGELIGSQHRFERLVSRTTRVKFMTDGILLAETRRDPLLRRYDTLIIDEAHERSLNIDFLLGWIKRILPRRPDLRVLISSATLDTGLLSDFFEGAPVLTIPGRLHPIEIRYRPPDEEEPDLVGMIADAVGELSREGPGDILVFLAGERDIREAALFLRKRFGVDTEIIPLLASLPAQEQQRAFRLSSQRRIVLATNVAETSLTLPGIRYVIDSGQARINRYLHRTQAQRLHIEPISRASADQRAGRCGRLGPGICIRLYGEDDFNRRPAFGDPELRRSSLAGVILKLMDLNMGDIASFPFPEPPSPAMIREGLRELHELGAVKTDRSGRVVLTSTGAQLAQLPLEPRLGRILLAGHRENSLRDALTVVAGLAGEDPVRRPIDAQEAADAAHAQWNTPTSDFASMLRLWEWWRNGTANRSRGVARRLCKNHYLSYPKMREWSELRSQLEELCRGLGWDVRSIRGGDAGMHRALLAGLLGRIGKRDVEQGDYRGARGLRFSIFPGSVLFRKPPAWVMAGELVDTTRLYARKAAVIDPEWIEGIAGSLCRSHTHSPRWDGNLGFVRATETVMLFGLTIVAGRPCDYSRIAPDVSRELFIRHALIEGDFPSPPPLLRANQNVLNKIRGLEDKLRRQGRLLDNEALFRHFDRHLPPDINNAAALRQWLKRATEQDIAPMRLNEDDWLDATAAADGFPDELRLGKRRFRLEYCHAPSSDEDGLSCHATRADAPLLREWRADWLVPGALREKVRWMLGCLPAAQRRVLGSADEAVSRCMTHLRPEGQTLRDALAEIVERVFGVRVDRALWHEERMPDPLRVRYVLHDKQGNVTGSGRDLEALLRTIESDRDQDRRIEILERSWRQRDMQAWSCGDLPERVKVGDAGWSIEQYPGLRDAGSGVHVEMFRDPAEARAEHNLGVVRLILLRLSRETASLKRRASWPFASAQYLARIGYPHRRVDDDMVWSAVFETFVDGQPILRGPGEFDQRIAACATRLASRHEALRLTVQAAVDAAAGLQRRLEDDLPHPPDSRLDMRRQLAWLMFPGFARLIRFDHLQHFPRYLEGIRRRDERSRLDPEADQRKMRELTPWWERYEQAVTDQADVAFDRLELDIFRWMTEEFRISLFAQELKTPAPISAKRLEKQWLRCLETP